VLINASTDPREPISEVPPQVLNDLPERFRQIYFHLYTNSNSSRAEKLVAQLALILMSKYASEAVDPKALESYLDGGLSANDVFPPLIREVCSDIAEEELRFVLGDELVRTVFREFGTISLADAPAHVLGEAFQALIGPRIRGDKGQFFTPRSLVQAMVEIMAPQPHESVFDPTCGTAGFLVEAHSYRSTLDGDATGPICGVEKDRDLYLLSTATVQMAVGEIGRLLHGNSLTSARTDGGLLTFSGFPENGFDVVLANPPFGAKIGIKEQSTLRKFALGWQWIRDSEGQWVKTDTLRSGQDPQILFLELCVRALRPGGRMGIVLPEGVFGNAKCAYVWSWLREEGTVLGLLDCPRTSFQPGTDTKTNVLFFRRKGSGEQELRRRARVAVATHCGHDRRGRMELSDGRPYPNDFPRLASGFHDPESVDWSFVEQFRADYYVPRYYVQDVRLSSEEGRLTQGAEIVSLGTLIDRGLIKIAKGHEPGTEAYGTGDIPYVRSSDLANFEVRADPTKSLSEAVYQRFSLRQKLSPGDILMAVDGRYRIGTMAMLHAHDCRCVVQSHLAIIRALRPDELSPFSLLFALHLPSVRERLRNLVFIQSTLGTLGRRLRELRLPLLVGRGPWSNAVERFSTSLQRRAEHLDAVKSLLSLDVEL